MVQSLAEQATVLVIDHSIDIHRVLKIRLREQNVHIDSAVSATDGLRLAQLKQPDLILLELNLPDTPGFEVLTQLKNLTQTVNIPVILLSDTTDSTSKVRGFDLGAVDFVTKPFDVPELRSRVRSALRTQRLVKMLAQRAHVDGLTGLWNRAHFDRQIQSAVASSRRYRRPVSLILADLDGFKQVNDRFGHPFGDVVLQSFAQKLEAAVRCSDIPCRFGGEEFAIIVPESDSKGTTTLAERCRSEFESIEWTKHPGLVLTASFGIACIDDLESPTISALIAAADAALYRAKDEGRNAIRVHPSTKVDRKTNTRAEESDHRAHVA